ncbi:hypothetical protein ACIGFK_11940 [Streptomyces sp. NPDC085524]|uniref:hypothetical protein n=1 Tax=unclassified Streptomyces TaxID=2593676 RepID=UPI0035DBDB9D
MSGRHCALAAALTRALTAACVVLLCVFGAGPAAATAAESRPASSAPAAPAEPTEGPSDPAADPELRAAVRLAVRGIPGARLRPLPVFHVKQGGAAVCEPLGAVPSTGTARSVVLRC